MAIKTVSVRSIIYILSILLLFSFHQIITTDAITPSGVQYIVNITINNQLQPNNAILNTSVSIQIPLNSLNFSSYLNGQDTNYEIFNAMTGNILYSWQELGAANTVNNGLIWIVLPANIAASTNAVNVISMGFASINTISMNGNNVGESPVLSPIYAEYDNGANVFTNYQNFKGTSLPSGWIATNSGGAFKVTVNNGFTINAVTALAPGYSILLSNWYIGNNDIEEWVNGWYETVLLRCSGLGQACAAQFLTSSSSYSTPTIVGNSVGWESSTTFLSSASNTLIFDGRESTGFKPYGNALGSNIIGINSIITPTTGNLLSVQQNKLYAGGTWNYTFEANDTLGSNILSNTGYVMAATNIISATNSKVSFSGNYIRERVPPPNNIMPLALYGQVYAYPPPSTPTLTASNTPNLVADQYEVFTASVTGGTSPYTYNYQIFNSITNSLIANQLYIDVGPTTNTFVWQVPATDIGNTISANVFVTDSEHGPITVNSVNLSPINILLAPPGTVAIVNVSLNNMQTTAISAGTQIMLTFNGLNYTNYFNGNTINFEIFNSITGNVLYTWFEGNQLNEQQVNTFNTASNIILWTVLPSQIVASTNAVNVISIAFLSLSSSALNGNNMGIAPQIWCASGGGCPQSQYAQYDDGANVFTVYDNFAGNSLSSIWDAVNSIDTFTVSNGLVINNNAGVGYGFLIANTATPLPAFLDALITAAVNTNHNIGFTSTKNIGTADTEDNPYNGYGTFGDAHWFMGLDLPSGPIEISSGFSYSDNHVVSLGWPSTGNQIIYDNYQLQQTANDNTLTLPSSDNIFIGLGQGIGGSGAHLDYQWTRERNMPPANVMPTIIFGSVIQT